ncbi:CDP-glycerol glycerophosphotransferase family protein [Microbispora sp. ATCC PTA-5024]|uniref:CDP-glycerol glycerophosphotransferase family protein n=1 Tax=Microbispora sp. ATCC PTA-5024 TaxID=316330 RepID=UPI0003DBDCDA|nr:CDP-glycerol glycerophosphotransferase family protein [Microbispora sp. ATCC PTA-5024]ETK31176.1 glycosyl transferase [Microbispora sp. ATCC PTA-5024]
MTPAPTSDAVAERLRAVQEQYDRGEPIDALVALVRAEGLTPAQRREIDREVLVGPLGLRLDAAAKRGPARRRQAIDVLRPYLAEVDPKVKRDLPVGRRVACHLIETRDPGELADSDALTKLAAAAAEPSRRVRKGLRWYADLPVEVGDQSLLRLRAADLVPVTQIDDISWNGNRLRITGHAYIAGLSVRSGRFNRATVVLRGPRWLPRVTLRTRRVYRPEATHAAREPGCNYDWAGFTAELNPLSLRWRAGLRAVARGAKRVLRRRHTVQDTTTWRAEIVIWSRAARARGVLRGPAIGRTERPAGLRVRPRWWVRPVWTSDKALQVVLQPTRAELTGVRLDGDTIEITGFLPGRPVNRGKARVGGHRMSADFTPVDDGTRFSLALAVQTVMNAEARRLWVEPKGDPAAAVMLEGAEETRLLLGDREITVQGDRRDRVVISGHRVLPVITAAEWHDESLTLAGRYPDPDPGPRDLVLRHRGGLTIRVPLERDGDRFTVTLSPGAMPRFGWAVPLAEGTWNISVAPPGKYGPAMVPARFDHPGLDVLDEEPRTIGGRVYRFVATRFDVPVLVAAEDRPGDERSAAGLWALSRTFYPAERARPLRDATVYVSFDGRSYSDNPRAVYEERLRRGDEGEHIWVVRDGAFVPPGSRELGLGDGVVPTVVREGSREHYEALARARYIVANQFLPQWFRTREDQVCVQTWHGTPVKHIGRDQAHMKREPRPPVWHRQAVEVRGWDLLVSQSPWASSVLRKAFGYEGEILECGYPRNDVLVSGDRDALAAAIRRRIGIPDGKRVILYAPTFRDYDRRNASVRLDLAEAKRALGDDHVVLVRGHMMQAFPHVLSHDGFAFDVTTYPDTADLLVIADVLVTDYSSVMFDFVATGRPVVLFTPDLAKYRSSRGLYLDLESQRPGPRLETSAEVVEALRNIGPVTAKLADRYAAFARTYAPHDNGKATARLVEHVFSS